MKLFMGLKLLRIGICLYALGMVVRFIANWGEYYYSDLLLPLLAGLAVWRPRPAGWIFLKSAFIAKCLFFIFCPLSLLANPLVFIHMSPIFGIKLFLLNWGIGGLFLIGAITTHKSKKLFFLDVGNNAMQSAIAIMLALLIPFLFLIEQYATVDHPILTLDNRVTIKELRFSPDGKKIGALNSEDETLTVWDIGSKTNTMLQLPKWSIHSFAFSGDDRIAIGITRQSRREQDMPMVVLWELSSGNKTALRRAEEIFNYITVSAAFSPDNACLAYGARMDNSKVDTKIGEAQYREYIEILDLRNGNQTHLIEDGTRDKFLNLLVYSPDGKYLASDAVHSTINIWDSASGKLVKKLVRNDYEGIIAMTYTPDGKYLVTVHNFPIKGKHQGVISIWDTETGQLLKKLEMDAGRSVCGLSCSKDGRNIASLVYQQNDVEIWDIASGKIVKTVHAPLLSNPVTGIAYSPDGKYLAVASGHHIKLYDIENNRY